MSAVWIAVWVGIGAPSALYASKRLIDWIFPPGRHLPWLDKFTTPNDATPPEEEPDEYS